MFNRDWIIPDWSVPANVRAITTTRQGGYSQGNYQGMNLAMHVNDDIHNVSQNRMLLQHALGLNASPFWLEQTHSTNIASLDEQTPDRGADGSTTTQAGKICAVLTADCLPVLLTDSKGERVAALHAGWRGLADGILENGVKLFSSEQEISAWLGPAIGAEKFEVGDEVVEQLSQEGIASADWYRKSTTSGKWLVDLYQIARLRLKRAGVLDVSGGGFCTFTDSRRFYSYRRQGDCGRMATLIWLDHQGGVAQT